MPGHSVAAGEEPLITDQRCTGAARRRQDRTDALLTLRGAARSNPPHGGDRSRGRQRGVGVEQHQEWRYQTRRSEATDRSVGDDASPRMAHNDDRSTVRHPKRAHQPIGLAVDRRLVASRMCDDVAERSKEVRQRPQIGDGGASSWDQDDRQTAGTGRKWHEPGRGSCKRRDRGDRRRAYQRRHIGRPPQDVGDLDRELGQHERVHAKVEQVVIHAECLEPQQGGGETMHRSLRRGVWSVTGAELEAVRRSSLPEQRAVAFSVRQRRERVDRHEHRRNAVVRDEFAEGAAKIAR